MTVGVLVSAAVLVALGAGPAGAAGAPGAPGAPATSGPPARRVVIVSLPGIAWRDLDDGLTPNLDALFDRAAIANLSTRAPTLRTDLAAGYATIGAGDKAVGSSGPADGEAFAVGEPFGGGSAADAYTRRTGHVAGTGIVHVGIPAVAGANRRSLWDADLGALGDTLARNGFTSAVVANADIDPSVLTRPELGSRWHREAALALVDPGGTVRSGRVDESLLQPSPGSPFGTRLDPSRVLQAFDAAWTDRAVVLVEASDLARADVYAAAQDPPERRAARARALQDTDALVGSIVQRVDPTRDAVVVVGPAPRSTNRDALTVAAVSGPGFRGGLLRSPTTLRTGYVQLMDVGPSVLGLLGLDVPGSMRGRPVVARGAGALPDRRAALVDGDSAASFRAEIRDPLTLGFVAVVVLLTAGALLVLVDPRRRGAALLPAVALATLGLVVAVYLARLVPFHHLGPGPYFAFLAVAAVVIGGLFRAAAGRRGAACDHRPIDALLAGLGTLVGLLVLDVVTGGRLQFDSGFGFSPEVAGRFVGLGNISYAFLAAGAVLLAGLVAHRVGGRRGAWAAVAVLAVAAVVDGAPFWGADVGGVLTMVPAFALTGAMLLGRRIRVRALATLAAVTVAAVAAAALVDSLRPAGQRTHLGRLVDQVRGQGPSAFTTVVTRKLDMNLATLSTSPWRPIVVVVLAFVAYLAWSRARPLGQLLARVPELHASLVGLAVVGGLGAALNDQGIVVPAVMLGVLSPVLIVLVVPAAPVTRRPPRPSPTAASRASPAIPPPRP